MRSQCKNSGCVCALGLAEGRGSGSALRVAERRTNLDMQDNDQGDMNQGGPFSQQGRGRKIAGRLGIKPEELVFDYKDPRLLGYFITDRGRIMPRRMTGLNAKQQRALTTAIKRARQIALLPYYKTRVASRGPPEISATCLVSLRSPVASRTTYARGAPDSRSTRRIWLELPGVH